MTYTEFCQSYNVKLNEQQSEAVRTVNGATLLLAVPGSGKTTVLINRIGYMVKACGINPANILTLTYNKAAKADMESRYKNSLFYDENEKVEFRTINGICSIIINYYARITGKESSLLKLEEDENVLNEILTKVFREVMHRFEIEGEIRDVATRINYIKNMMFSDSELLEYGKALSGDIDYDIVAIYKLYVKELRAQKRMDYDDQMRFALNILNIDSQVLEYFQERFKYICVDEAQDSSKIQHAIISKLASKYNNIFMVGDEDQSIYGFRAAYPEALLSFEENYKNAKVLLMEKNYRSDAHIVKAADYFIARNTLRHKKNMQPHFPELNTIKTIEVKNRAMQYEFLASLSQTTDKETAVLFRYNESIIPLVDLLERRGIPYILKKSDMTFFSHRTMLDIKNIIQFAYDEYNSQLFLQIYYKLGLYLSRDEALRIVNIAQSKDCPVLNAALDDKEILNNKKQNVLNAISALRRLKKETAVDAINTVLNNLGYKDYMNSKSLSDSKIVLLKTLAKQIDNAAELLDHLEILKQRIQEHENPARSECNFILSTIHSSKGLEYEKVYLMDVFDGYFPETVLGNYRYASDEEISEYEEERRIFYVGITRARKELYIFKFANSTFLNQLKIPAKATVKKKILTKRKAL